MTAPSHTIECRTSVVRAQGRQIVCCEIDHFIPSGLTVPELFARLRPQLVASIEDAAARAPDVDGATPARLSPLDFPLCARAKRDVWQWDHFAHAREAGLLAPNAGPRREA